MSEFQVMIVDILNKPGSAGKKLTIGDIIKELCYNIGNSKYLDFVSFEVYHKDSLEYRLFGKNSDKKINIGDEIKEKLDDNEYFIAKFNDNLDVTDVTRVCSYDEVFSNLETLVELGLVYRINNEYRSFPKDKGYVQDVIYIDENNNGHVYNGDSTYFINSFDLAGVLNEDIVVIAPTNKKRGNDIVAKINKVVKRKDGLLPATVVVVKGHKQIKADNKIFYYSLYVDSDELETYQEGDRLLVMVSIPNDTKVKAKIVRKLEKDEDLKMTASEDKIVIENETVKPQIEEMNVASIEEISKQILGYVSRKVNKSYGYNEIYRNALRGIKDLQLKKILFEQALKELQEKGLIVLTSRGLYKVLDKNSGYVQCKIKINKYNEGLLEDKDGVKYIVGTDDLKDALDGDIVLIKPTTIVHSGRIVSTIERIIKRKDGLVVVEVNKDKNGEYFLRPFNAYISHPIIINSYSMKPLVEGDRILVKIDELDNNSNCYYAGFIKNIGHKDDPDADLKVIAIQNNIIVDFSGEALEEASKIPTKVLEEEKEGRLDLTDKMIYTIDGSTTKDRDDAISIEVLDNGNYQVGVHISDVSHYVHPGMKLWDEALLRGTSVYMVDTVIPMIPHKLSNGICSLNEGEDRLAFSCIMEVTKNGQIVSYDFVDTIINSKKAMTYESVNELLEEGKMPEGYEEFYDNLLIMKNLSKKLEKIKEKRGYVDLGTQDLEIIRDEEGKPLSFKQREQKTAEKIIENLMLLAGECYANYMVIPTPRRVHEKPDEDKVEQAFELLEKSGIKVKSCQEIANGHVIQQILKQIDNIDERNIAANIILRSMKRARYDINYIGHFGLGLPNYGHFTSPIRRAADLRGHYNLRIQRDHIGYIEDYEKFTEEMAKFCHHISKTERNADQAEQDANEYEMTRYVLNHIGEKFECHVTYISPKVIYVKTLDGINGKLLTSNIKGDTFRFNDTLFSYIGKKTRKRIKLGTYLTVTAINAEQEFGSVAFGVEAEDLKLIKGRKKGA